MKVGMICVPIRNKTVGKIFEILVPNLLANVLNFTAAADRPPLVVMLMMVLMVEVIVTSC